MRAKNTTFWRFFPGNFSLPYFAVPSGLPGKVAKFTSGWFNDGISFRSFFSGLGFVRITN
jgi:hypothetical protein